MLHSYVDIVFIHMNGGSHLTGFRLASFVSPFPVCLYFPSARPESLRSGEVATDLVERHVDGSVY